MPKNSAHTSKKRQQGYVKNTHKHLLSLVKANSFLMIKSENTAIARQVANVAKKSADASKYFSLFRKNATCTAKVEKVVNPPQKPTQ